MEDIWREIDPMLGKVMYENEGTYVEEQLLIMERNGYPEETYYIFHIRREQAMMALQPA